MLHLGGVGKYMRARFEIVCLSRESGDLHNLQVMYQLDLKKTREAVENETAKAESAANDMFQFYVNLLSVDAKYAWNKIIQEKMQSNPYTDPQGISKKGPQGPLRKSFDDCVMFHLLIVFPTSRLRKKGNT